MIQQIQLTMQMIVNALNHLTDLPKEIITFSDDMDGLRKIPDNVPQKEKLKNDEIISKVVALVEKKEKDIKNKI